MRLATLLTLLSSATFIAADITLPSAFSAAQNLARDAKDALNKRASAAVSAAEAQITPAATTPEEDEAEWLESARLLRIQAMAGDKDAEIELAARSVGSPELAYLGSDGEPVVLGRSDQEDREFLKARDADEETYWVEIGEDGVLDVLGKRDETAAGDETAAEDEEDVGSDDYIPSEDDR